MQDRIGQKLGNYRLIRLTGKGGHAEVYLAENIYLDTKVAIKLLVLDNGDSLEQDKFLAEAKFMMRLKHPHIIEVLDYGLDTSQPGSEDDGTTPYFVMEYASLGTLRDLYSHGTLVPLHEILSYVEQIAGALQYAHDQDIIHLDVKPENMLLRKPNDVILSDFGIAIAGLNTSNLQQQSNEASDKTARGELLSIPGTALYLAPERLLGHTQRASDQYSLAIVVYEWLCGKRPFSGSDEEICRQQVNEPPPSIKKINPLISEDIEQVVMKALSKQPENRYPSVEEFFLALKEAIQSHLHIQSLIDVPTVVLHPSPNWLLARYPTTLYQPQPSASSPVPTQPQPSANSTVPSQPQPSANPPVPPQSTLNIPPSQQEWWRHESQAFVPPRSIGEVPLANQQSKSSTHPASPGIKEVWNELSKLIIRQPKQPGMLISTYSQQMLAPSTTLFPGSIRPREELKDFFISHCRTDDEWAEWIAHELIDAGFTVIVPEWDFRAGSNIKKHMDKAAAQARSSIVILSPDYFTTSNTQSMRDILLGRDVVNKGYIILPVLVHEINSDLRLLLEHIKYIDLVKFLDDEATVRAKLLAEVRGERAKPRSRMTYPGRAKNEPSNTSPTTSSAQSTKSEPAVEGTSSMDMKQIEIFFSYSHKDEGLLRELETHLMHLKRQYVFRGWYDRDIDAGLEFAKEIDKHLKTAQIILLLVTPDFIASDYCYNVEVKQALERHKAGKAFVVPIILRHASWKKTPLGKLQVLPNEGKPVITSGTTLGDRDAAFVEIATGIEKLIEKAIADKL